MDEVRIRLWTRGRKSMVWRRSAEVVASKECGGVGMELDSGRTPRCFWEIQLFQRNYCLRSTCHVGGTKEDHHNCEVHEV